MAGSATSNRSSSSSSSTKSPAQVSRQSTIKAQDFGEPQAKSTSVASEQQQQQQSRPNPQTSKSHNKNSHRRRRRRANTATKRRSSVMVDHDNEVSIMNDFTDAEDPSHTKTVHPSSPAARRSGQKFYPMHQNLSSTSLDSTTLLDHREQKYTRPRRSSVMAMSGSQSNLRPAIVTGGSISPGHPRRHHHHGHGYFQDFSPAGEDGPSELRRGPTGDYASDNEIDAPDTAPLLGRTPGIHADERTSLFPKLGRPASSSSGGSGKRKHQPQGYGSVNFPPSVPTSPNLVPSWPSGAIDEAVTPANGRIRHATDDHIIQIDRDQDLAVNDNYFPESTSPSPPGGGFRRTMEQAEEDVCFPVSDEMTDGMTTPQRGENGSMRKGRRRTRREWPDLSVFEEWSREEKEERSGGIRARQISEPVYVGGRLRPTLRGWHREVEDLPYRFTYFNDELSATIHAQTISELITPGETTFRDLFIPPPRQTSDDECSSDEENLINTENGNGQGNKNSSDETSTPRQASSRMSGRPSDDLTMLEPSFNRHGISPALPNTGPKMENGAEQERPTWWLDVLSPTKAEMKVFQDAFGIHPLTAEDILMQEPREKVELFRNYYLVSYRTFEQDPNDEDYMEPVNFYIIVFRTGVLSFHFSMTPHGANVRRRIRQLKDYMNISADWISYALIDNITDAFGPIIQNIEDECDEIDEIILADVETSEKQKDPKDPKAEKEEEEEQDDASMLRRIATCRKKVMGLYRLMGNKADVIKGFSKRCNEHWDVAPRSEIGLYLGDIQDHIVTMVANLVHVEKILSRGHSNYLAQISIKMNERSEETADTLGRLSVLGTIVLPMNIVTGLWGMNVLVPGQGADDSLTWFWCITGGLFVFGILCYFIAKRVYKII